MGAEDRREDPAHPGTRAVPRGADGLPRRLGGGAHNRAGADVPGAARRRADLPQPGQALRRRAAGLCSVRAERGRRRLHPRILRHRDHARGQRLDVPGVAAHGRDGDRREGHARGDGGRQDAHRRLRLRPPARAQRRRGDRVRPPLPLLSARELALGAARRAAGSAGRGAAARRADPRRREQAIRHQGADRGPPRRGLAPGDPPALGKGAGGRLRAPGRAGGGDRRQPAQAQGRRAVLGLRGQGRAVHLELQRLQRAAPLPRRCPGFHDRHAGRARRHHPPRRQDDQRSQRGDRAEDLGDRSARPMAPACMRWRAPPSSRTAASRCRARR